MKMEFIEIYKDVVIERNPKFGNYYLVSPYNQTLRIFDTIEGARRYLDNYKIMEENSRFIARNPW